MRGLRCFWLYRFGGLCPQVTWNKRLTIRERGTVGRVIFGRKQSQNTVNTHVVCPWRLWNNLKPGRNGNAGPLSFHGVHKTLTGTKNKVESSKRIHGPKCLAESWQNPQGSKRIKGPQFLASTQKWTHFPNILLFCLFVIICCLCGFVHLYIYIYSGFIFVFFVDACAGSVTPSKNTAKHQQNKQETTVKLHQTCYGHLLIISIRVKNGNCKCLLIAGYIISDIYIHDWIPKANRIMSLNLRVSKCFQISLNEP